ncbi:hypothetical protein E5676_scaffold1607G00750 [Cucumis melo var. makuwa]|uniref:Uncharacterized protein n=1 Tax=Cucumis melo var. makuwa TaxID=1194695 RepID=A0A5A7UXG2_CUCMM|nr:hypothetical protein E6C27_scaffold98G00280 [Cucumis melo var. makuwa]TYK23755.1 hypothetical protein E5676_scaffold1607G00750 [Cucumis melo var. makuwa]
MHLQKVRIFSFFLFFLLFFFFFTIICKDIFVVWRGDSAVSNLTSTAGRSSFCCQIHRLGKSDWTPLSFGEVTPPSAIQLLLGGDRAFIVRSTVLVGAIEHLTRLERGDSAVSDPTSTGGRLGFCRQIYRLGRSDREPSSFREVTPPLAIQLLLEENQAFAVKSIALRGKGEAAPLSSTQDYNILEMSVDEAFVLEYEDASMKPLNLDMEKYSVILEVNGALVKSSVSHLNEPL